MNKNNDSTNQCEIVITIKAQSKDNKTQINIRDLSPKSKTKLRNELEKAIKVYNEKHYKNENYDDIFCIEDPKFGDGSVKIKLKIHIGKVIVVLSLLDSIFSTTDILTELFSIEINPKTINISLQVNIHPETTYITNITKDGKFDNQELEKLKKEIKKLEKSEKTVNDEGQDFSISL